MICLGSRDTARFLQKQTRKDVDCEEFATRLSREIDCRQPGRAISDIMIDSRDSIVGVPVAEAWATNRIHLDG